MGRAFGEALTALRLRRGLTQAALGALVNYSGAYIHDLERRRPAGASLAAKLDEVLAGGGELVILARADRAGRGQETPGNDDEADAYELADQAEASDVGPTALAGLEAAFDRFAIRYQAADPADLLLDIRRRLTRVGTLMGKRATLAQRRRLHVVGGWLSLLAATLHIDLRQQAAANARLATALSLAEHAGHDEIMAWCLETRSWDALTEGRYRLAVDLARSAQRAAPRGGSALIQATAQEGRAWARLGDRAAARDALDRVEQLVSPLGQPDEPEHHYQYDPGKQHAYVATTLSWVGDTAAVPYARAVVGQMGGRPRRAASARLDLALALTATGQPDEAAAQTLTAIKSGRIVLSNAWRAREVIDRVEAAGLREATELREAYESIR